jgi:hypothetical protein
VLPDGQLGGVCAAAGVDSTAVDSVTPESAAVASAASIIPHVPA